MKNFTLCKVHLPEGYESEYPFNNGEIFVFLGEISNMKGHCVVARRDDGKIFSCYHSDNFVELSEDEV
jgi:hypothetical protein